jgi:hypothetical protein
MAKKNIIQHKYTRLPLSVKPLLGGDLIVGGLSKSFFIVVGPDGHILTEREYSDVIADNMLINGKKRPQKAKYKLNDLSFFNEIKKEE